MNDLLAILQKSGPPTVPRLKRLYRRLSKQAHPDITRESHEAFLKLRHSYEEALSLLENERRAEGTVIPEGVAARDGLRTAVLRALYRYALKFDGRGAGGAFATLLELVRGYNLETWRELSTYRSVFLETYASWVRDGRVYYTHSLWIASIRVMAYYLCEGRPRYRRLLQAYTEDLNRRAERLDAKQRDSLCRLGDWLLAEAGGERIRTILEV